MNDGSINGELGQKGQVPDKRWHQGKEPLVVAGEQVMVPAKPHTVSDMRWHQGGREAQVQRERRRSTRNRIIALLTLALGVAAASLFANGDKKGQEGVDLGNGKNGSVPTLYGQNEGESQEGDVTDLFGVADSEVTGEDEATAAVGGNDGDDNDKDCQVTLDPMDGCRGGYFFAKDADEDWVRDTIDKEDMYCSNSVSEMDVLKARFNENFRITLGDRNSFNFPRTILADSELNGLANILVAKGIVKDPKAAELAFRHVAKTVSYFGKYANGQSHASSGSMHFYDIDHNHWAKGFEPEYSIEVVNGVLHIFAQRALNEPESNLYLEDKYTADLFPWGSDDCVPTTSAGVSLAQLTPISSPKCPGTDWEWERPANDPFDASRDLNFQYQSGVKEQHRYLAELAKLLPSNWNIAAFPDKESGVAIEIMFDQCCDLSPEQWLKAAQEQLKIGPNETVVIGTRGGFVVQHKSGSYAFEPGKKGHQEWNKHTRFFVSGSNAVQAELSDVLKSDIEPRVAATNNAVVRRGNPDGAEKYWNEGWCKNTAPAGLAAIKYLVGNAPFWMVDDGYGGFNTFDGSGQFKLLERKALDGNRGYAYKVQFKETDLLK